MVKFLSDPGCACNVPLYRAILQEAKSQLEAYYPGREATNEEQEIKQLSQNHWSVINCHIDEVEDKLRKLPNGRKQIAIARFQDQVTLIINEIDVVY